MALGDQDSDEWINKTLQRVNSMKAPREQAEEGRLNTVFQAAQEKSPDTSAKVLQYQKKLGIDPDLIESRLVDIEKDPEFASDGFNAAEFRRKSPKLAKWLQESPHHIAVAKPDLQNLQDLEKLFYRKDDPRRPLTDVEVNELADALSEHGTEERLKFERSVRQTLPTMDPGPEPTLEGVKAQIRDEWLKTIRDGEEFIADRAPVGFLGAWAKRFQENPAFAVPLGAGLPDAVRYKQLLDAAHAVEGNTATPGQLAFLLLHGRMEEAARERGTTFFGKVGETSAELPAFVGETLITGPTARMGRAAAERLIRTSLRKALSGKLAKVATKVAGTVAGEALRTPLAGVTAIPADAFRRMNPDLVVAADDEGRLSTALDWEAADGFSEAFLKAGGSRFVEHVSEQSGEAMLGIKGAIASRWLKKNPTAGVKTFLDRAKDATGWHGIITEVLEERVGEVGRAALGIEDYKAPTWEQLAVEAVTFAIPGAAAGGLQLALREKKGKPPEHVQAEVTAEKLKRAGDILRESKIIEHPEIAEPILESIVKGSEFENAYADVNVWEEYWQSQKDERGIPMDPKAEYARITGDPNGYDEAVNSSGELVIPYAKYATQIETTDHAKPLSEILRFNPLDMSVAETKREIEEQKAAEQAAIESDPATIAAEEAKGKAREQAAKNIESVITRALSEAGEKRSAKPTATLVSSFFRTLAEREDVDLTQLFGGYQIDVKKTKEPDAPTPTPAAEEGVPLPEIELSQPGKRGRIRIGKGKFEINLYEGKADKSTPLHEFGHMYLGVLSDLVKRPEASEGLKADMAAILDWMGVKDISEIKEAQHEKWAEALEAYLREGKAPSAGLRAVFHRVMRWLNKIYEAIAMRNELTPEIRGVMDRIFATDAEIEAARAQQNMSELAQIMAAVMPEKQAAATAKAAEEATEAAKTELRKKVMAELGRERKAEYQEKRERIRKEVAAEVDARKEYVALANLQHGTRPDGSPLGENELPYKLSRQSLKKDYPALHLSSLPRGVVSDEQVQERLIDAQGAAEVFGFRDGDELLTALVEAGVRSPREPLIESITDERMKQMMGGSLVGDNMAEAAMVIVHSEKWSQVLRKGLEFIASTKLTGMSKAVFGRVPRHDVLQVEAEEGIGDKPTSQINPALYQRGVAKASRDAAKALKAGDFEAAFKALNRAIRANEWYQAATKARDEADKMAEHLQEIQNPKKLAQIGKGDPEAPEQILALLERYSFRPMTQRRADAVKQLDAWIEQAKAAGFEPAVDPVLLAQSQPKNYRDVPLSELRAVYDAVVSIEAIGKRGAQVRKLNEYLEKEIGVDDLIKRAGELKSIPKEKEKVLKGMLDRLKDLAVGYDLMAIPPETLFEILDGGAVGPWHDLLWNRASDAQSVEYDLHREVAEKLGKLIEKYVTKNPASLKDTFQTRLEKGKISRFKLISIALNMGNKSNLDKMIRGEEQRGNNWTEELLREAVANLNKRDLEFVNGAWGVLESLYPMVAEIDKRVSGLPAPKIEATPFALKTKDGDTVHMQGGYYPVKYDPRASQVGVKQETGPLAGLVEESYAAATTPASHRKARTGYAAPMLYDFGHILQRHLNGVIKDISHREFFIDAIKILRDQRIRAILQEKLGERYEPLFMAWLKGIANDGVTGPMDSLQGLDRFLEGFRANVTTVALGYKISTILTQVTGFSNSFEYIASNYGAGYFVDGFRQFRQHPAETYKMIVEKSGEMRNRWISMDRDYRHALRDAVDVHRGAAGQTLVKFKDTLNEYAYAGINIADRFVTVPTWLGAYRGALDKGASEDQAIHAGDAAVRRSQGAGGAKDLAEAQRRRGFYRLFTTFMTPFIAQYGRLRAVGRHGREKGFTPAAAYQVALITMVPSVIGSLIADRLPDDDDKDGDRDWGKWLLLRSVFSLPSTMPYVRDIGNAAERYFDDGYVDFQVSPVVGAVEKVGKAGVNLGEATFGDREWNDKVTFDAFESSGYFTGLPTGQARVTLDYLYDFLMGDEDPDDPASFLHGMVYRRYGKKNK